MPPYHRLVKSIPWDYINSQYTVPKDVLDSVGLDPMKPVHNMLIHRFDGGDDRIFAFDANLRLWRHVPNVATFQDLGFYWCDVTAADDSFFERLHIGPPLPPTTKPARADYPSCHTFLAA